MEKSDREKIKFKIRALLKLRGWNWSILALRSGFSNAAISLKMKGLRPLTQDDIQRFAYALGVPLSDLLAQETISFEPTFSRISIPVPILNNIPTKYPIYITKKMIRDWIYIPGNILKGKSIFGIKVFGDSMSPMFEDGDYVIIISETKAKNRDIIAVRVNDEPLIVRFLRRKGRIILQFVNPNYEPIIISERDKFQIIGIIYGIGLRRIRK
ncbi:hypothetical protein KAW65_02145 [candidate division WOR-3 bacterium]|nr:hypothetical protein [candidate division WOR-3 bacterium]